MRNYPCDNCKRVSNPEDCENKKCAPWQKWFTQRWDATRASLLNPKKEKKDPCIGCVCPAELCDSVCREKQAWEMGLVQ